MYNVYGKIHLFMRYGLCAWLHLSEAQWQRIQPYHEEIRQEHQRRLEPSDEYTWAISNATQKREHMH